MPPADTSALKGKKIVIVEDDTLLHNLLADKMVKLRESGVEVYPTLNAEEALKTAREVNPDLILLDIAMPSRNGFEIIEELRKEDRFKKTLVIILSNMNKDSDKARAKELGISEYLVKADFSLEDISKVITKALQGIKS